jgi:hypothetical protein
MAAFMEGVPSSVFARKINIVKLPRATGYNKLNSFSLFLSDFDENKG